MNQNSQSNHENHSIRYAEGFVSLGSLCMMNAAAPDGEPPRRINDCNLSKTSCPAVPRRGPEAGDPRKYYNIHEEIIVFSTQTLLGARECGISAQAIEASS